MSGKCRAIDTLQFRMYQPHSTAKEIGGNNHGKTDSVSAEQHSEEFHIAECESCLLGKGRQQTWK